MHRYKNLGFVVQIKVRRTRAPPLQRRTDGKDLVPITGHYCDNSGCPRASGDAATRFLFAHR